MRSFADVVFFYPNTFAVLLSSIHDLSARKSTPQDERSKCIMKNIYYTTAVEDRTPVSQRAYINPLYPWDYCFRFSSAKIQLILEASKYFRELYLRWYTFALSFTLRCQPFVTFLFYEFIEHCILCYSFFLWFFLPTS